MLITCFNVESAAHVQNLKQLADEYLFRGRKRDSVCLCVVSLLEGALMIHTPR